MRYLLSLLPFISLLSCTTNTCKVRHYTTSNYVLADTIYADTSRWNLSEGLNEYPIYYLGPAKDSLSIGRRYWPGRTPKPIWPDSFYASCHYSNNHLSITVDTNTLTDRPTEYFAEDGSWDYDAAKHYQAHIVTIRNISDTIMWIGPTFSIIHMHLECRDKQGKWIAIQKIYEGCGTGQPRIYLKPGEIIITKLCRLQGSFLTECRLAFGYEDQQVYSNVFTASVNELLLSVPYQQPDYEISAF